MSKKYHLVKGKRQNVLDALYDERAKINRRIAEVGGSPALDRLTGIEGYHLGVSDTLAYMTIMYEAEKLVDLLDRVIKTTVATEGLPPDFQATQLRNSFTLFGEEMPANKLLTEIATAYADLYEEFAPIVEAKTPGALDHEGVKKLIHISLQFARGIKKLLSPRVSDNGDFLRKAIMQYSDTDIHSINEYMRENAKTFGRPNKPTPLNAYILQETRRLKALHGLKSRGEQVKSFMEFLETHADVQRWKATQHRTSDRDTSIELQAYIVFHDLDSEQRRDKLREIEDNNPNFQG